MRIYFVYTKIHIRYLNVEMMKLLMLALFIFFKLGLYFFNYVEFRPKYYPIQDMKKICRLSFEIMIQKKI